jgi:hypothetical protein
MSGREARFLAPWCAAMGVRVTVFAANVAVVLS